MALRKIAQIVPAVRDDIDDLITRRALPTQHIGFLDPFLFLNHHGPQVYPAPNHGLPFGPHPHRGFETVTFILKGDLMHSDSGGHESVIKAGGVQWMTAGKGLVHAEVSSQEFLQNGGDLEILQLWVNLPAKLKMTRPAYRGLQKDEIPTYKFDNDKIKVHLAAGEFKNHKGVFQPLTDISLMVMEFSGGAHITIDVPMERTIFFYVVRGHLKVNGANVGEFHLAKFENEGDQLHIETSQDVVLLFGHAKPFNEPIVSHGPFVMNTREEIMEAFRDYQAGKFE